MNLKKMLLAAAVPIVAVSSTVALPAMSPGVASANPGCAANTLMVVPGTWETSSNANPDAAPKGMLAGVTKPLMQRFSSSQLNIKHVPYEASAFDQGLAYTDSKVTGVKQTAGMIAQIAAQCPSTKFFITGYSQGADVAGDVASMIGNGQGPINSSRLGLTVLYADPGRGTPGEKIAGPHTTGVGLAGPRKAGFGSAEVITICADGDRYCSTDPKSSSQKLMATLGNTLAGTSTTETGQDLAATRASLVPGVDTGQVSSLPTAVADFSSAATTLKDGGTPNTQVGADYTKPGSLDGGSYSAGNFSELAKAAKGILGTVTPLVSTSKVVSGSDDVTKTLASAPSGSSQASANTMLGAVKTVDLSKAESSVKALETAANADDSKAAYSAATSFVSSLGSLPNMDQTTVSNASSLMNTLQPAAVLSQVSNIVTGFSSFNYMSTMGHLQNLPQAITTGNIDGAYKSADGVFKDMDPLVKMADNIDLGMAASMLRMVPAVAGPEAYMAAQVGAQVLDILNKIDFYSLYKQVDKLQGTLYSATKNPAKLAEVMPILMETSMSVVSQAGQVAGLPEGMAPEALTKVATSLSASDLLSGAVDVAGFYQSGVHGVYPKLNINGKSSLAYGADQIASKMS